MSLLKLVSDVEWVDNKRRIVLDVYKRQRWTGAVDAVGFWTEVDDAHNSSSRYVGRRVGGTTNGVAGRHE